MSAQSYSPLAQVYNPVIVDVDDNMMEDLSNPGNSTLQVISYGPATRRRFTPTQRRPHVEPPDQAVSSQLKRFPTISTTNYKVSPPERGILRSRSGDRTLKRQRSSALQSNASEFSNGEHQDSAFMQRLDVIERSQAKIESLLAQVLQNISSNRS